LSDNVSCYVRHALFARGSWAETSRISGILRKETVGGGLLLAATVFALIWANSPWSAPYDSLGQMKVGTDSLGLHLNLSLTTWAADGCWRSSSSSSVWNSNANSLPGTSATLPAQRCRSLPLLAEWFSRCTFRCFHRACWRRCDAGVGDTDRDGYRVRSRRLGGDLHSLAVGTSNVSLNGLLSSTICWRSP